MERLRTLFGELGFEQVRSYIQTGNVFFGSQEQVRRALRSRIEEHLRTSLGYAVATCLRMREELEALVCLDPFHGIQVTPDMRLAVTFFTEPILDMIPFPYLTPDRAYEIIGMTPTELFVVWHLNHGRPGQSYGLLE